MNNKFLFLFISLWLSGWLITGCATTSPTPNAQSPEIAVPLPVPTNTPAPRYSQIYAFGDDYSDNGNAHKMVTSLTQKWEQVVPWVNWFDTYYWQGRWSNGPLPVEVLAEILKIDLVDYCVAGALSDTHNNAEEVFLIQKNTGLLSQVQKLIASLSEEKADADALYVIQIGDVDFEKTKPDDIFTARIIASQVVANIGQAISQLASVGANQFVVVNMHDISKQPLMEEDFVDAAQAYQTQFNAILPSELEELAENLDLEIKIFDYAAVSDGIKSKPGEYGLTNLEDACLVVGEHTSWAEAETTVCNKPDEHYYWDDEHPTRRVNQIIGEAMAEQLGR